MRTSSYPVLLCSKIDRIHGEDGYYLGRILGVHDLGAQPPQRYEIIEALLPGQMTADPVD